MVFDICCAVLSMYLFIKPIRNIMKHSANNITELKTLLTKYVLISSIAIFSNLLSSIWFSVTDILIFTYLDIFLNPICLMLMQIHHSDLYMFFCKYCHQSLGKVMTFPEQSISEKAILELRLQKTKSIAKFEKCQSISPRSTSSVAVSVDTIDSK